MVVLWIGIVLVIVVLGFGVRYWRKRYWLLLLGVLALGLGLVYGGRTDHTRLNVALCRYNLHTAHQWRLSYWYLDGSQSQRITRQKHRLTIHTHNQGQLKLLVQAADHTTRTVRLKPQARQQIDLSHYPKQVTLTLQAKGAKGQTTFNW
jgi:hypothetical protein